MLRRPLATIVIACVAACAIEACRSYSCTLVGCDDGALLTVHLHRPVKDLSGATITICLNGACTPWNPREQDFAKFVFPGMTAVEDGGWVLVTLPRLAPNHFPVHDGDRYRVRIVNAAGSVLLDVERILTYDRYYPNGEQCGGACLNAASAFYETSQSGLSCSGHASTSEAAFTMTLDDATARRAVLTVCRNDVCNTEGPGFFPPAMPGPLDVSVGGLGPPGLESITVFVRGEAATLRDGDHYRLSLVDSSTHQVIKSFDGPVSYETSFPNGEACDVFPSHTAHIALD